MARKVTKKDKPSNKSGIGKKIEYLRTQKLMTQDDLGKLMGRERTEITMYENGTRSFDFATLTKFADIFNVSTDYLLGRTDIESSQNDIITSVNTTGLSEKSILTLKAFSENNLNKINLINYLIEQDYISTDIKNCLEKSKQMEDNNDRNFNNNDLRKQIKYINKIISESKSKKSILDNILNYMSTKIDNQEMFITKDEVISSKYVTSSLYKDFVNIISNEIIDGNEIVDKILIDKIVDNLKSSKKDYLLLKDGDK